MIPIEVSSVAKTRHTPRTSVASSNPPTEHHRALHPPGGVGSISHRSFPAHAKLTFPLERSVHSSHPRRLFRISACLSSLSYVSTSFATSSLVSQPLSVSHLERFQQLLADVHVSCSVCLVHFVVQKRAPCRNHGGATCRRVGGGHVGWFPRV